MIGGPRIRLNSMMKSDKLIYQLAQAGCITYKFHHSEP